MTEQSSSSSPRYHLTVPPSDIPLSPRHDRDPEDEEDMIPEMTNEQDQILRRVTLDSSTDTEIKSVEPSQPISAMCPPPNPDASFVAKTLPSLWSCRCSWNLVLNLVLCLLVVLVLIYFIVYGVERDNSH